MPSLTNDEIERLRPEVQMCCLSLTPGAAMFVKTSWLGKWKPTSQQKAWYLGFIGGWGSEALRKLDIEPEFVVGFVSAVFIMLFEKNGQKLFNEAVASVQLDGPLVDISLRGEAEYVSWDKGAFVPTPPSA